MKRWGALAPKTLTFDDMKRDYFLISFERLNFFEVVRGATKEPA